jgi:hypothetical protein
MRYQRLNLVFRLGRLREENVAKTPNRTTGNPAVRDYRGAS